MFKNAGVLVGGDAGTGVLDLGTLALTARGLGPEGFGILVLIQTYTRVVDTLMNFQSWEAVIKYGADAITAERGDDFRRLVKLGTLLDAGSALIATAAAAIGVWFLGQWQDLEPAYRWMAVVYSGTILFNLVGTPTAILRLHDRFTWLASTKFFVAAARLAAVSVAWFAGGGLWSFLIIWGVAQALESLTLLLLGWYQLREEGYGGAMAARLRRVREAFPGLVRFVLSTNFISSIKLVKQELDVLLIGATLTPALVGIYKVAKQFGKIPSRFAHPLQQAIYPDLAKLWAEDATHRFRRFLVRIGLLAGAFSLLLLVGLTLFGRLALELIVGPEYLAAYVPMLVIMAGVVVFSFGVASRPALLTLGRADRILLVEVIVSVTFLPVLWLLLQHFAVLGVALAQLFASVIWLILMAFLIVRSMRTAEPAQTPRPVTT